MDLLWVSTNMLSLGYILNNMQKCEIMLNDLIGSKRTNTNIKATIAQPSHTAIIMQFQDQKSGLQGNSLTGALSPDMCQLTGW
ncbi:uncharacterized protein LOC133714075 isoform X8 [Rosa rugosa]|uniref:uncharacterized protein LOC133714075 isoform X8 n=1 Tax=Rosa rugosa TaxID=74645 RepID=UPI002B404A36|nr:uncharacterized protein LOC133714075 isoform X8 [Rosa rugosa]XP_061996110.1 uncharacterized protein LOC133714075 isoform X8 [Rosa rugosa]